MIRKEAVLLPGPDPAGLRMLSTFRAQIGQLDAQVAAKARAMREFGEAQTSQTRGTKFAEMHARMVAEDSAHRPSDRAFPIHPMTASDKDLWTFENIRQWYSGGDATLSNSLRDPAPDAAREPSGPGLVRQGYLRPADPSEVAAARTARLQLIKAKEEKIDAMFSDPSTNARATSRRHWTREGREAHWLDRQAVLESEQRLAKDLLRSTGYSGTLVKDGRPFKTDFPVDTSETAFKVPSNAELMQRETIKGAAASNYDRSISRARATALRASRPEEYGFGKARVDGDPATYQVKGVFNASSVL